MCCEKTENPKNKRETDVEKEAAASKKKKSDPDSDEEETPMPSQTPGPPLLPIQLWDNNPPTDKEDEDSDGTVFYPEEGQDDSLLVIDEAEWRGLSEKPQDCFRYGIIFVRYFNGGCCARYFHTEHDTSHLQLSLLRIRRRVPRKWASGGQAR